MIHPTELLGKSNYQKKNTHCLQKLIKIFILNSQSIKKTQISFEKEIQDIERIISSVCELREKKIVQAALSKIRGGKPDLNNMLDEEKKLFDSVIDSLLQSRKNSVIKD